MKKIAVLNQQRRYENWLERSGISREPQVYCC